MTPSEFKSFTSARCCDACGQPLKPVTKAGMVVALRTLNGDGSQVHVSQREQQIVEVLLRTYPDVAPHEHIFLRVWGYESDVQVKTLDVYVCKLRRKLAKIGFDIHNVRGVGYQLVKHVA